MNCLSEWECLTSDPVVLNYVSGYKIEFLDLPVQFNCPRQYNQNRIQKSVLQTQIDELCSREVIKEVEMQNDIFISNVFGRPKPNGDIRMIIDLSQVNEFVDKFHFKMDHLNVALEMVDKDVFMTSIDLKDAYYSVPIWEAHRKYLSFQWEDKIFQFQVLPFGLSSAPRVFTKILKPVFSKMREEGFSVIGYIDDSLIFAETFEEGVRATNRLAQILTSLGFTINLKKSVLTPSNNITFLGYIIDSKSLTVSPTQKKRDKALELVSKLKGQKVHKIRFVASAIGFIVDLCKGIEYGANYFRFLERDKVQALRKAGNKGYDGKMVLSSDAISELNWWGRNVKFRSKKIRFGSPRKSITTDASLEGWGAIHEGEGTGGRWSSSELLRHINVLELHAILLGLQSFFPNESHSEILIKADNTTAVSYVNRMGGSKSFQCEEIAKSIWQFCEVRDLWIVATHIPGVDNEQADFMSRNFTDNTEWSLNPLIFDTLVDNWGLPQVDMFASRLNHKVQVYVSWLKDPQAFAVNAFTTNWDNWSLIYVFPPFSLVTRCLRWIKQTTATVILVVPDWPGQHWFSRLKEPLVKDKMRFPRKANNLLPQSQHLKDSLIGRVPLLACLC